MLTLLGWAGFVIVIVIQPSPGTAEAIWTLLGSDGPISVILIVTESSPAQASPDQERPEATLRLLGWAGLVLVIAGLAVVIVAVTGLDFVLALSLLP